MSNKIKEIQGHPVKLYRMTLWGFFLIIGGHLFFPQTVSAGVIFKAPASLNLATGLVGYWTFDGPDISNVTAIDKSGNGNSGTLTNGPTLAAGKIGQGLNFDGSNDYVTLGTPSSLNITGVMSASAWVYVKSTSGEHPIVSYTSNIGNKAMWFMRVNAGKLSFVHGDSFGFTATGNTSLSTGQWYHMASVRSGSSGAWTVQLYINGVLDKSATTAVDPSTTSADAQIGGANAGVVSGNQTYSNLNLDDIRVYNRVLSAAEIKRLYNMGVALKIGTPPSSTSSSSLKTGLVGYWTFDEPDISNVTAIDKSGQNNNGTLTNGPTRAIGKIGQGLKFDGGNDYVSNYTFSPNNKAEETFSFWIKDTSTSGAFREIISLGDGSGANGNYILVGTDDDNPDIVFYVWDGAQYVRITAAGALVKSQWIHVVALHSVAQSRNELYVNGVLKATGTIYQSVGDANHSFVEVGRNSNNSEYFSGVIDDVRIYNRILSAAEIKRLYNMGVALKVGTPPSTTSSSSLKTGLVGYWTFDEPDISNVTAIDKSGQNNNGTLTNGPTRAIGKIGQGLKFDGVNDLVNVTANSSIDNLSAITVSAWMYPRNVAAATQSTLNKRADSSSNSKGWKLGPSSTGNGRMSFVVDYDSTDLNHTSNSNVIVANVWQHVLATWDGSTSAANAKIYINGVETTYATTTNGSTNRVNDSTTKINIGANQDATQLFGGTIDDVRIYNRVLSTAEIKRLYNMGR